MPSPIIDYNITRAQLESCAMALHSQEAYHAEERPLWAELTPKERASFRKDAKRLLEEKFP